jgi:predicted dehydrogenase
LGGSGFVSPNNRINVGYIGAGTQGIRQLTQALGRPELQITSVCDPNTDSSDYVEWSRNELRDKIRTFLDDSRWGEGNTGCRCGREVGREIVESYYGRDTRSGSYRGCAGHSDFRTLLQEEKDLDAVYIMTPDHLQATIA